MPSKNVKDVVRKFEKSKDYIETKNLVKSFAKTYTESINEKSTIDFKKYEIIELEGADLEAILPHLRPLIKKSYDKIGGKQGNRTIE